jgi:hypothetical protein
MTCHPTLFHSFECVVVNLTRLNFSGDLPNTTHLITSQTTLSGHVRPHYTPPFIFAYHFSKSRSHIPHPIPAQEIPTHQRGNFAKSKTSLSAPIKKAYQQAVSQYLPHLTSPFEEVTAHFTPSRIKAAYAACTFPLRL